mmetsp:Transcript_23826/g.43018  ORF Transcript_23826/g.43018 Transcript_23826/m.43018 type:complete len:941 (+) Transcript_23826:2674-5496(+)
MGQGCRGLGQEKLSLVLHNDHRRLLWRTRGFAASGPHRAQTERLIREDGKRARAWHGPSCMTERRLQQPVRHFLFRRRIGTPENKRHQSRRHHDEQRIKRRHRHDGLLLFRREGEHDDGNGQRPVLDARFKGDGPCITRMQLERRGKEIADGNPDNAQPDGSHIGGSAGVQQELPVLRNPRHGDEHDKERAKDRSQKLHHRAHIRVQLAQRHADGHRHQQHDQHRNDVFTRDFEVQSSRINQQDQRDQYHTEHGRGDRHQDRQGQIALGEVGKNVGGRAPRHTGHDQDADRNGFGHRQKHRQQKPQQRHDAILAEHPDGQTVRATQGQIEVAGRQRRAHAQHDDRDHDAQQRLCELINHCALLRCNLRKLFSAQVFSEDFANIGFWQLVAEFHAFGDFVAGQMFLAISAQGVRGQVAVRAHNERFDRLACGPIRHADHSSLQHGGVRGQNILNLVRIHVKARNDDHILFAVHDADIAIRLHHADIAGQEPIVDHDLGGLVGLFPVALHDLRAARGDLTRLANGQLLAVFVKARNFRGRHRNADGPFTGLARRLEGQRRRGFGQPIALNDLSARNLAPARRHRRLQRHAASPCEFHVFGRAVEEPLLVAKPIKQRVHPTHPGDFVVLKRAFEVGQRARIRDQDVARPHPVERQHVHGERKDMVKWQSRQNDLFTLFQITAQHFHRLFHVHDQVAMGQHRTFGHARGAASILQHSDIITGDVLVVGIHFDMVLTDMATPGLKRCGQADMGDLYGLDGLVPIFLDQTDNAARHGGQELGHAGHNDIGDRVTLGCGGGLVGKHIDDDQRMRFGILELLGHLVSGIKRIDVDEGTARLEHTKGDNGKAEAIGHLHCHPVAHIQARNLAQIRGKSIRHLVDLCVGERAVHAVGQHAGECLAALVSFGNGTDQFRQVAIGGRVDLRTHPRSIKRRPRPIWMCHVPPL